MFAKAHRSNNATRIVQGDVKLALAIKGMPRRPSLSRSLSLSLSSFPPDNGGNTGTRNSNKLLAESVPAVLKYLGGESLRETATMQVTGCSTQPPKLKRVYAGPGLTICGTLAADSAAACRGRRARGLAPSSDNTRGADLS